MPSLTFTSSGPLTATVHLLGPTVRAATVADAGGGHVALTLGDVELAAQLVGPVDILAALIEDAALALAELRDGGR